VKNARALVVDDDPGILEVLEMRLQSMGLEVSLARNYQNAITLLDDRGFDVALFDLRMEPINGLKLMAAAHERQPPPARAHHDRARHYRQRRRSRAAGCLRLSNKAFRARGAAAAKVAVALSSAGGPATAHC